MKDPLDILKICDGKGYTKLIGCRWPLWIPLQQLKRDSVRRIFLEKAKSENLEDIAVKAELRRFLFPSLGSQDKTEQVEYDHHHAGDDLAGTESSKSRSVARVLPTPRVCSTEDKTDNANPDQPATRSDVSLDESSHDEADDDLHYEADDSLHDEADDSCDDPDYEPSDSAASDDNVNANRIAQFDGPVSDDAVIDPAPVSFEDVDGSTWFDSGSRVSQTDSDDISVVEDLRFPGLVPARSPDPERREVACTSNGKKRVWDRKNVCLYCGKELSNLSRHLQRKHVDEPEVSSAMMHDKGSEQRRQAFLSIRERGNYAHNIRVRCNDKKGVIIPCRRSSAGRKHKAHDFLVCDLCRGFFFRKTLWRHKRSCARKRGQTSLGRVQNKALAQMPTPSHIPPGYQEILDKMMLDDVALICKSDQLITQFGIRLYEKLGKEHHQHISAKLRELGRLVKELKRTDPNASLKSHMTPGKFDTVTTAVRNIAQYDNGTNKYGIASLALKLGHSVKKCAAIEKANCIQKQTDERDIDGFAQLMELEWTDKVSRRAHKTLEEEKWNKSSLSLPLTEDLSKLQEHLSEQLKEKTEKLRNHPTSDNHKALAEVILARLILFNRRRQGEAGKLTVDSFGKADRVDVQPDVLQSLSQVERQLAKTLKRVVIRGKKGRGVPMLLTEEVCSGIDLLIETRQIAGLTASNYVFTNAAGTPMRGCDALKKFAESCGARSPKSITSTNLRKHIATVSQVLNLRKNELDQLASFLGHDLSVHREFYRLPSACAQVTQISKLLIAAENNVQRHRGKRLEDIDVDARVERSKEGEWTSEDEESEKGDEVEDGEANEVSDDDHHEGSETETRDDRGNEDDGGRKDVQGRARPRTDDTESESVVHVERNKKRKLSPVLKKTKKRQRWYTAEKAAVERQFFQFISRGEVPGKSVCLRAIEAESSLRGKEWKSVKYCVYNMIQGMKRRVS